MKMPPLAEPREGDNAMTMDEMKCQYQAKQEKFRKLEAEQEALPRRGEPVPQRIS